MKQQMFQDQAEQLRAQVQDESINGIQREKNKNKNVELLVREMDILDLPPRSEVHQNDNRKIHLKINRPFIRFTSFTVFIVLVISSIVYLQFKHYIDIFDFLK